LSKPSPISGVTYFGSTALLIPPIWPISSSVHPGDKQWGQQAASWALEQPFTFWDAADWSDPKWEFIFVEGLAEAVESERDTVSTVLGEETSAYLTEGLVLPNKTDPFTKEFSAWVQTGAQRAAWKALADSRQAVENYKNSGRARLPNLDAALEEIYSAESGPFLLSLGQTSVPLPINQRNFITTLSNVYRHCGLGVPAQLNRLFSDHRSFRPVESDNGVTSSEPFFVAGDNQLTWNDPAGDDFGGGAIRYPVGSYPSGTFDLRKVIVRWTENEITFSITMGDLSKSLTISPLIDVYLDVNRLAGAGSSDPLKQRGLVSIDKQAAWEYALSLSRTHAILYQSLPGHEPRRIATFPVVLNSAAKTLAVSVPADSVRGKPTEWRLSVGIGGTEPKNRNEDFVPIPALAIMGDRNFSGAVAGRDAPRYIDILAPTAELQKEIFRSYEENETVVLPFVEPPS